MRKSRLIKTAVLAAGIGACLLSYNSSTSNAGGPNTGAYTNAPGESACGGCHGSASTNNNIQLLFNGSTATEWIPDSTYTVTVRLSQSGISKWGFMTTVLDSAKNEAAGTISNANGTTQTMTQTVNAKTRSYILHTSSGNGSSGQGSWTFNWKAPSSITVGAVNFYVVVNATNNNGGTSGDQVNSRMIKVPATKKLPVATITSDKTSACQGDTITFTGSATNNPTGWAWQFSNGTPSTATTQTVKVVFGGSGNARLIASNSKGKSQQVTFNPTILLKPADTIFRSGNTTFCQGDSVVLTAPNADNYLWNNGATSKSITVKSSGSWNVQMTNANGCNTNSSNVSTIMVPKQTLTVIKSAPNDTFCSGDVFRLEANSGFVKYVFKRNSAIAQEGTQTTYSTTNPGNNSTWTVEAEQVGGCVSVFGPFVVRTSPKLSTPIFNTINATVNSLEISWQAVTNATYYEVSADTGKTWVVANGTLSHTVSGLPANTSVELKVRARNATACGVSNELSRVGKTLGCGGFGYQVVTSGTAFCPGAPVTVTFSQMTSTEYAIIHKGVASKALVYTYTPSQDTTLAFEIIDSATLSCPSNVETFNFTKTVVPALNFTFGKASYCEGEAVQVTGAAGFTNYAWYVNGSAKGTGSTLSIPGMKAGEQVELRVDAFSGCAVLPITKNANVKPVPVSGFTFTQTNTNPIVVKFTNTSTGGTANAWDFGDTQTSNDASPEHTYAAKGTYKVKLTVTNADGCSNVIEQDVEVISTGLPVATQASPLVVYPNPFTDNIQFDLNRTGMAQVEIVGMSGAVQRMNLNLRGSTSLNLGGLQSGLYVVHVTMGTERWIGKVMKR